MIAYVVSLAQANPVPTFARFEFLILIVAVTLATSFLCSMCEAALYSVSATRVEQLAEKGSVSGRRLKRLRHDIGKPIAAILTLNTIANTVGATIAGWAAGHLFDSVGVGVFSAFFTLSILYLSEIIPKTVGVIYADSLAPGLGLIMQWMIWLLWPLVWACQFVTRLFPRSRGRLEGMSEEDILAAAKLGMRAGLLRPDEARWVQNALRLDCLKVGDIMTPRTVMFTLPDDWRVGDLSREAKGWLHTRIPVTEGGDIDKINGVVMRRDVYAAAIEGHGERTLAELMRKPTFVPEAMTVSDLLTQISLQRQHLFIVADEYGGTAGVVTLEDAVESLLGVEIVDEFDRDADLRRVARRRALEKFQRTARSDSEAGPPGAPDVPASRPPKPQS